MIVNVFGVYDKKAEAFLSPFTFSVDGQAVRAFQDSVNDPETMFNRHPDDYDLYKLGYFDQGSGEFESDKHYLLGARSVLQAPTPPAPDLPLGVKGDADGNSA